jgi:hypothetical protein
MPEEPVGFLISAIAHAKKKWAGQPAFKNVLFKLQQIENELAILNETAGQQAAREVSAAALPTQGAL